MEPAALFETLRTSAEQIGGGEFSVVDQLVSEGVFGSRYVTFRSGDDRLRLAWDGKEEWFVLEFTATDDGAEREVWEDVMLWRYPAREQTHERADEISRAFEEEFRLCVAQSRA